MKRLLLSVFLICSLSVFATHERAGEITYVHLFGLTYEVTILTYTYSPSPADRPELLIKWGDGSSDILPRVEKTDLGNDIRRNRYVGQHTYNGSDNYVISMEDPNRNYGIINIPNSVNVPFYIETELIINPFLGANSSPVLLIPPIDNGCVYIPFIHNPGAYDVDGDSLSYRLIDCKGNAGLPVLGYTLPPYTNSLSLNPVTGDFIWDSPPMQGEFNVAILIEEWRNGVKIGSVTRDMQINIVACDQEPPVIEPLQDTCVEAGTYLEFDVTANDPDNDYVTLNAVGGPLMLNFSPATFDSQTGLGTVSSTFKWQTHCQHVKLNPYIVYFKATDNGQPVNLVDIKSMKITVVAPAPENLIAYPLGSNIELLWDKSPCDNAISYQVFRKVGYYGFIPDHCETGVPAYTGYKKIADIDHVDTLHFTDDNNGLGLVHGLQYCYMVVAVFPDGALSYASLEACATLKRDVPIITNVSVTSTSTTDGTIYLAWAKPTALDPGQTPGPFKYYVVRSEGQSGQNPEVIDSLFSLNDTIFNDTLLNTRDISYSYRIDLYNITPGNVFYVGSSNWASSVYLNISPTDNELILSWTTVVPWINDSFVVYRENPVNGLFDSIGMAYSNTYNDTGLINGQTYCYYLKSMGHYFLPELANPIVNNSQIKCGSPIDNVAPCPPILEVETNCDLIENYLTWLNPSGGCASDVASYNIYFAQLQEGDYNLIHTIDDVWLTYYTHANLAAISGCYAVTSIDTNGNQSEFSNIVCVDIDDCPRYKLPNVFTPNNDGWNDLFIPFPYTSVDRINLIIFNRWGSVVFKTEDPDVNWDGKHTDTGQLCSDGTYFYTCEVYEIALEGPLKRILKGSITLIR